MLYIFLLPLVYANIDLKKIVSMQTVLAQKIESVTGPCDLFTL